MSEVKKAQSLYETPVDSIVLMHNPLNEDFTFRWDKVPYTVPAGGNKMFPAFLAKHGAKHLTDYIILHPELWSQLELKRDDAEEKLNAFGTLIKQNCDLTKGRDEILKLILIEEQKIDVQKSKTEGEKVKTMVEDLNKEKEFEDLSLTP